MSWLDDLLAGQGSAPLAPTALFPGELTEAEQAAAAREAAAAAAAARAGRRSTTRAPLDPGEMAGQPPIPFSAGMLSPYGLNWPAGAGRSANLADAVGASAPLAPAAQPSPAVAEDMPPSTNDPASGEPVLFRNGVPLPRPRPPGIAEQSPMSLAPQDGDGAQLPSSAREATTAGTLPAAPAPPSSVSPASTDGGLLGAAGGLLGKVFNPANAPLLLAMGGGFAGAPSFGTGMRRGFTAAAPQAALLRREQVAEGGMAESYRALVARGVPPHDALAAVRNPDIMKALVARYFETRPTTVHTVTDPIGGQTLVQHDPVRNIFLDMNGRPIAAGGEGGAGLPGGIPTGVLAPGVTFDPQATGDAYLAQFSPDVQASVRAYINGDVQPSGNPRQRTIANFAKTVAQRYGQDMGVPVSDTIFAERRRYRSELGSTSPSTAGGQARAFNQGIEHAHALADQLVRLGNYDPVGVPGVSRGINWFREAFSTRQAGIAAEAKALGQTLAGEVGKLFSGSAGGGVHERELTRNRFSTVSSPAELASALSGTIETMEGGLRALESHRDRVLGPNNNVTLVTPETHARIAHIREVIARLRGERTAAAEGGAAVPAAAPAAPAPAPAPGRYVLDPASGRLVPAQ